LRGRIRELAGGMTEETWKSAQAELLALVNAEADSHEPTT